MRPWQSRFAGLILVNLCLYRLSDVFRELGTRYLITQARYLRLVLLVAMSQFMRSEKGDHQVLMMMDEFANLGALSIIENGYGLIAGHGITLWSFVQNLSQLKNLYPNNWETFIANSSVITVSNVNDVTTAEYFSLRAGKGDRWKTSHITETNIGTNAKSRNESSNLVREDNLPVIDFYCAKPNEVFLFYGGQAIPEICNKALYDQYSPYKERAKSNPMYKGEN